MTTITITLVEPNYRRLQHAAERAGKSVQAFLHEWISQLPFTDSQLDLTQDPLFQIEGHDSAAPANLASNIDHYLYAAK